MSTFPKDRRSFLKGAGWTMLACGCAVTLPVQRAMAADACASQTAKSQAAMTPDAAFKRLKDGNARFVGGMSQNCNHMTQVRDTGDGQHPFAATVGCIDSRASNELMFDQGVRDIFSARVAGNFVNDDMLGSLEFACAAAGAKLIVVVGHTECGAIKGACDDVVLGNLTQTLANIKPAVAAVSGFDQDRSSANGAFVQAVADRNVELTIERIRQRSQILKDMESGGDIAIKGAMYDVHTGVATFG
jgi:carbonic anhydrase